MSPCTEHTNLLVEYQGNEEKSVPKCADTELQDGSMQSTIDQQHRHPTSNGYNHLLFTVSQIVSCVGHPTISI